jgi:HD-like signal output (HDOD) protein/GGDEF domain-containing protein
MSAQETTIETLVARAQRLYSLPVVAMKVLELAANPQVDTYALKHCIENDPALTGKILRTVNSSLFGLSHEVSDLNQALALLGTKPLKLLVLGFSLPSDLFSGVAVEVLGRYWRRTLTKAVAGREISEAVWRQPGDDAFIAALLQDIGMLLLIQEVGPAYVKLLESACPAGRELAALENQLLGFDHTVLSARLLGHWGLPEALVEAVAWSPQSSHRPPTPALPQIVYLAELVARLLVDGRATALGELLDQSRQYHPMSQAQLEILVGRLENKVQELADVLSLELPYGLDYRDVLVQSQAQLADVADAAVRDLLDRGQGSAPAWQDESLLRDLEDLARAVTRAGSGARAAPTPPAAPAATMPANAAAGWVAARRVEPDTALLDLGLLGQLDLAVAACRQKRCSLSLILVELRQVDKHRLIQSAEGLKRLVRLVEVLCQKLEHPQMSVVAHGEAGFAILLPDCDRQTAVQLGNRLIAHTRQLGRAEKGDVEAGLGIVVGLATAALPPKNFPAEDLLEAADRCLYGSRVSGGNVLKSIEI